MTKKTKAGYRKGLSDYEKETFYHYNEDEKTCSLSTFHVALITHMKKLGISPDSINEWGEHTYTFPKAWMRKPRIPKKLTGDAKAKRAEQLRKGREKKGLS